MLSVAALQFACSWDLEANLDRAEQKVREAAARGAGLILLPELFATPYFCIEQDAGYLDLAQPAAGNPLLERFACAGARTGRGAAGQLLRARPQRLLQLHRDHRRRRPQSRRLPQGAHSRRPRLPGEVLLHAWRHRLPRLGHALRPHRRGHLLGPVVPGVRARDGAAWAPKCCCIRPPSAASRRRRRRWIPARHWQRVQQGHAAANMMPIVAANRIGVERARRRPGGAADPLLRLLVHRRWHRRQRRRGRSRARGGAGGGLRPRRAAAAARELVRVPRPSPGPVRAAADGERTLTHPRAPPAIICTTNDQKSILVQN